MNAKQKAAYNRCAKSFEHFCSYLKIHHHTKGEIAFDLYLYQKRLIEFYERNNFVIAKKFRQGGFTTVTLAYFLWLAVFRPSSNYGVISRTDREARYHGKILRRLIESLPTWLKPETTACKDHLIELKNGSKITLRTPSATVGCAFDFIFIDEPAFIGDMDKHWKALYPTISNGGKCIAISTPNGDEGWFYDMYYNVDCKFKHFVCSYEEHPEYRREKWIREMQKTLGPKAWRQEVLAEFLPKEKSFKEKVERLVELAEEASAIDEAVMDATLARKRKQTDESVLIEKRKKAAKSENFTIEDNKEEPGLVFEEWVGPVLLKANSENISENIERPRPEGYQFKGMTKEQAERYVNSMPEVGHPEYEKLDILDVRWLAEFWKQLQQIHPGYEPIVEYWQTAFEESCRIKRKRERNIRKSMSQPELLTMAGLMTAKEAKALIGSVSPEENVLYKLKNSGNLPRNIQLSFDDGRLCVNDVPTIIREDDCRDMYNGNLAFEGPEKATEIVVQAIENELMKLFRREEPDDGIDTQIRE